MRARSPGLSSRTPSQATNMTSASGMSSSHNNNHHPLSALQRLKQRQSVAAGGGGDSGSMVSAGGLYGEGSTATSHYSNNNHVAMTAGSGPDGFATAATVAVNQERRLAGLVDVCAQLERQVAQEVSIRVKGTKALSDTMEQRIAEAVRELEDKYQDRVVKMHVTVDSLTNKLASLEDQLAIEREKNARLTEELMVQHKEFNVQPGSGASSGGGPLQELWSHLEHQKTMGHDALDKLVQRVTSELSRLDERLDAEHFAREQQVMDVQTSLIGAAKKREEGDRNILSTMEAEVAALAQAVDNERREREVTEENLAVTLEQLVAQIDAMR